MLRRLLAAAVLTAGLLTVTTIGRAPAGHAAAVPGSASRPVTAASLSGVVATSANDIWAVGGFGTSGGAATLVEHGNGRTWKPVLKDLPPPENYDSLNAVAATSASNVFAAGAISTQYDFPLLDQWSGHRWSQDPTPTPGGDGGAAYLNGVATTSAKDTWSVGAYLPNLQTVDTLVLHWNGKATVQVPSPSPGGSSDTSFSILAGVSAASPTDVWAVGEEGTGQPSAPVDTLIEHWNGTRWATVPSPSPSRGNCTQDQLNAVTTTPGATWAVGNFCGDPLALRLIGGNWQPEQPPPPPAGVSDQLSSVSATSPANAWAVGNVGGDKILILHWNGTKWATSPAPAPAGAKTATLTGVSAVSGSAAWAVGSATYPNNVRKLLIERWTGTRWKLVPISNPTP
jgi:hypothetical protein